MAVRSEVVEVRWRALDDSLSLPKTAYPGDAGFDLQAAIDCDLAPGQRCLIPTGMAVAIPEGYAGFVVPRSGLALSEGLSLVNSPGLIDSQYRGELKVIAINLDSEATIHIKRADRIAQLVILALPQVVFTPVDELDETLRGSRGFGSSNL